MGGKYPNGSKIVLEKNSRNIFGESKTYSDKQNIQEQNKEDYWTFTRKFLPKTKHEGLDFDDRDHTRSFDVKE